MPQKIIKALHAGEHLPESLFQTTPACRNEEDVTPPKPFNALPRVKTISGCDSVYEISEVLEYAPKKGYLVHWKGFSTADRSWQKPSDMPQAFRDRMLELRREYRSAQAKVRSKRSTKEEKEDKLWKIDEVLDYHKEKGYFVSWVGFGPASNSWQKPKDMPAALRKTMKRFRDASLACSPRNIERKEDAKVNNIQRIPRPKPMVRGKASLSGLLPQDTSSVPWEVISKRIIHSVVRYDPTRGVLVHWKNLSQREDTWLAEDQVGDSFRYQILLAKERYIDNVLGSQSAPAALLSSGSTP